MSTAPQLTTIRQNGPVTDADHQTLMDRLTVEMKPATEHEHVLVGFIVKARWKLDRIHAVEAALLERTLAGEPTGTELALMMRYSADAERSYYKAQREFSQSRRENGKQNDAAYERALKAFLEPPALSRKATLFPAAPRPELASFGKNAKPSATAALGNLALRL